MTQDLFSALLAGFFELCGLRSANFNRYLNLFSTPLSSGQQVAIGFGIINVLLVIFWVNRQQIFACLNLWLAIVIPTVLSDLTLNNSLNNVIGDMRSSSWILLGCGGLCYLLAGSVIKRKELSPKLYILTAALATLSVFPGIPGPLIIIFILILFGFRPKETVALVLTAQIPLLFLNTTSFFSSWRESIDTTPTTHLIGFYLATCAGSAAAFYLLNKFIKARRIKAGAHLFSAMACFLLYYTSRHPIPSGNEQLFQYHNPMRIMGTACQIKLIEKDPKIANEMLRVSLVLFNKIENTLSTYKPDSEINAMNISAHEKPFLCSNILWDNFMLAEQAWKMSNGAFDVTIGPLVKLWGIKRKRSQLPTTDEINTARNIVGFHLLTFDREKHTVSFQKKGIKVDFGGITKGWAVDMVAKKLLKMGLKKGFINLGGNIFSIGKHTILIKNPADPTKNCSGITLQNQGIATSGNYEQFIEIDGKKYTHIIDPRTGMPVPGVDSVSVVSPSAAWSDILSTAIFIEGQDLLKKLKKSPDIHALILDIKGDKNSVIKQGTIWGEIDLQR